MSILPSKRSRAIGIYGPKKRGWRLHGKPYKRLRFGMRGRLHRDARLLGRIIWGPSICKNASFRRNHTATPDPQSISLVLALARAFR